jgi:hypothetical protein
MGLNFERISRRLPPETVAFTDLYHLARIERPRSETDTDLQREGYVPGRPLS